jgi:hypothetical protein
VKRIGFILVGCALVISGLSPARPGCAQPCPASQATPNLVINVSAALINEAVQRSVDRLEPFEDVVLETPVCGLRRTLGNVRMDLIPDPDRAVMEVVLNGTTYAQGVSSRNRVRLYTCTTTPFEARQRIVLAPQRVCLLPMPGWACAQTTLVGVADYEGDPDPPTADFVRRGFRRRKAEAEAEISAKAVQQTTDRLGWESLPAVRSLSQSLSRGLSQIRRRGLTLETMQFRTETDHLQARLRFATPGRKGPQAAPLQRARADLSVRVHQSLVNAEGQAALGGNTYPLLDLEKRVEKLRDRFLRDITEDAERQKALETLRKLLAALGGKPATITFAKRTPVLIVFGDSAFTVEFNVAALGLAGQSFTGGRVRAAYRLEHTAQGVRAVRRGPIQFLPPAEPAKPDDKIKMPDAPLRLFQEAVFGQVLKARLARADLSLPAPFSRLAALTPTESQIRNGWLQMDWKLTKKTKGQP